MTLSIIYGTNKPDELNGTTGIDLILSGNGADWVAAGGGDDVVISGRGDDRVFGEDGNDRLITGRGDDTADGGAGDDTILTGQGNDLITGGRGNDLIDGGRGWDTTCFLGDVRQYLFTFDHTLIMVTDQVNGETDTLANVEVLKFDNAEIFLDGRNNGPVADDVGTTVHEDGPTATGDLLAESDAFDFDGDLLSIVAVNGAATNVGGQIALTSGALLTVMADGTYTYDPNGGFEDLNDGETATDSVSFTISDGTDTITRTLSFTITGETDNFAPVATDVLYVVSQSAAPASYAFDVTDESPATLVYTSPGMQVPPIGIPFPNPTAIFVNNLDGTFSVIGGQDLQAVALGDTRDFTFTYWATDEFGVISNEATATLRVIGENDAPRLPFGLTTLLSTVEDSGVITNAYNIIDPDTDNSVEDLDYTFNVPPGVSIVDNGDGSYSVDTDEGFDHLAPGQLFSIQFTATDRHGASATFSNMTVFGANDDPEARDDGFLTGEDSAFAGDLFADNGNGTDSDIDDGDIFVVSSVDGTPVVDEPEVIQLASDALLTINPDGTFVYDPNGQFDYLAGDETATDSFVYEVTDLYGGTAQATATITILGIADSTPAQPLPLPFPLFDA